MAKQTALGWGKWLIALTNLYLVGVGAWLVARAVWGDSWKFLFILNAFGVFIFVPLLGVPLIAWYWQRRETWLGFALGASAWLWFFGGLFIPNHAVAQANTAPTLRVMTYNMLVFADQPDAVVEAIRASKADVIGLQELHPFTASAIQHELATEYPYQVLDPRLDVTGMGLISRYPMTLTGTLDGDWVGQPQVLTLDFHGTAVTLINCHPFAGEEVAPQREAQSRILVDFVRAHPGPLLLTADMNATNLNTSYTMVADVLGDAWVEAGTGLGHTFPGSAVPGSSRPHPWGFYVPQWLVRIDFVFHSPHWRALNAEIGPFDGVSDHRPVFADLVLTP